LFGDRAIDPWGMKPLGEHEGLRAAPRRLQV
jgi:hypothetical protein